MNHRFTRRSFLRRSTLAAGAVSAAPLFSGLNLIAAPGADRKLNCALIGCGGRSMEHLKWLVTTGKENIYAIVDPDENRQAAVKRYLKDNERDPDLTRAFTDYRQMFDSVGKNLDVVVIATPNHHHALPSMLAMNLGIGVYCEKPLTHDISEARKVRTMSQSAKAATQMGNQGHCEDGYRRLCEFIWGGVVGNITETHSWTDRANGGEGPRPPVLPVPATLHWDEWIGPGPFREFTSDLHPHEWHGWYDFGNGSIGNMGCHVLDGVYWALKLEHPTKIESLFIREGTEERYPMGSTLRWDFPARGDMPPVKVYWYEGLNKNAKQGPSGSTRSAKGANQNLPPLLADLQKQYPDEEFESNGSIYVGEKGVLYTGTYGGKMHILPMEKMQQIKQPPRSLPRPRNVMADFVEAVRDGRKDTAASFDYGARLTEFTLLGNLAQRAGVGHPVEWDGPNMKVTNNPSLNEWIARPYRKGWTA